MSENLENEELIFKLNMFEQQVKQLQQQIRAIEQSIVELNSLHLELDEINEGKGKEILASVGRGIFVKAKLLSGELIVDVGGRNFVKKNVSETKQIIEEQINKLNEVKESLRDNLDKVSEDIQKVLGEAQERKGR
ncbi:prefoldin subunit alpha [Candidatus Pacearchaeota archaeon]|nr:MAG: prefoldin subunit alpha [Candidatus Pacearchaeota archaeon]